MASKIGYKPNFYDYRLKSVSGQCTACLEYDYTDWANWFTRADVKSALHVCETFQYDAWIGKLVKKLSRG